jgi:hypothetical protein
MHLPLRRHDRLTAVISTLSRYSNHVESSRIDQMNKVTYKVVRHDGAWAYEANGTHSERFKTREAARKAAKLAASERVAAGGATTPVFSEEIEWQDESG